MDSYDARHGRRKHTREAARRPWRAVAKLRLLIFSPYFPPHVGGLEGYVSDLDDVLLRTGEVDEITVFTPWLPSEGPRTERRGPGYLVVRYPALELIPNFPVPKFWKPELWRALRSIRPSGHDVFVSHTRFFLTSTLALLCARLLRRPLLHVEHGSDFVQLSGRLPRMTARVYDLLLGRLLLRHADGVVAISHAAAAFVERLSGREVPVVHRGMWTERLQSARPDAEILAWAAGRPLITFVGRLIDGKGVPDLLYAYAELALLAVVCIVGDGPRRMELEALAEQLGLSSRVKFCGYLPEERAWGVIQASEVVVNPSYTEGLPTSVLEAALLGRAVLASDVGGTPEIVTDGEGGVLFKARDVKALRSGLELLLGDPDLRERMGVKARTEAAGRFDWNVSATRFAEIARELVSEQVRGRPHTGSFSEMSSTSEKADS